MAVQPLRFAVVVLAFVLLIATTKTVAKDCNVPCQDNNRCTDDTCDRSVGLCVNSVIQPLVFGCCLRDEDCNDLDECTQDKCLRELHQCSWINTCNEDLPPPPPVRCTTTSDCEDFNVCTKQECDRENQECVFGPAGGFACCSPTQQCQPIPGYDVYCHPYRYVCSYLRLVDPANPNGDPYEPFYYPDPYYEYDSPCYSNYYGHCHGSKSGQYETWRHTWNALDIVAYSIGYAAFLCLILSCCVVCFFTAIRICKRARLRWHRVQAKNAEVDKKLSSMGQSDTVL